MNGPLVVAGMFRTANGIGRAARSCMEALQAEGLAPLAVDLSQLFSQIDSDANVSLSGMIPGPGTIIVFANPPELERALFGLGLRRWQNWRVIGAWAWELPVAPPSWRAQCALVSEVWAPSAFVNEAFERAFDCPVKTVPLYVPVLPAATEALQPETPDGPLRLLTLADARSSFVRKNVLGAMDFFTKAFASGEDVRLVVKCRNLDLFKTWRADITAYLHQDSRIELIDGTLDHAEHAALLRRCNAILSCHRSEGFGLHLAEAMASGRSVAATGWSGNMQFMSPENAFLFDYTLIPVADQDGVYSDVKGAVWAEPDTRSVIQTLRAMHAEPAERLRRAKKARQDIALSLNARAFTDALSNH